MLTRPLVTAGISFLTTALVVSFFSVGISLLLFCVLLVASLIAFAALQGKARAKVLLILLSGLAAATSYAVFASNEYDLSSFDGQSGSINAIVTEIAPAKNSKTAYTIEVKDSSIEGMPSGFRAILYAKSDVSVDYYDSIQVEGKAQKITSSPLFNIEQFYRTKGIDMTFSSYHEITILSSGAHSLTYYAKRLNAACSEIIDRNLPRPYAGLMKAMLLGNDSDIDDIAYDSITKAGVTHVFVVSGLHISLIAMLVLFLLKLCRLPLRARSVVTIFVGWGLVAITGFGIPAIRAGIMLSVLMGANLFRRKSDGLTSLFLSGILIVLLHPVAVIDPSFLLTFTATLGILLFARPISDFICVKCNLRAKLPRYFAETVGVTLAANLMMLPVIIYTFKGISLAAPLTNLVVVPLLPVILVGGILLLGYSGIPLIAGFLGEALRILLSFILKICEAVSTFDFVYIGLNYSFVLLWLTITILLLIATALLIRKGAVTRNVLFISFAGLFVCFGFFGVYNRGNLEITTLNSFEAERLVLTCNGGATVVAFGDDNYIDVDVAKFLRSKNIHRVENYIFTESGQKSSADTEFLAATTDLYHLYLEQEDSLLDYAADSFKPINGVYPLKRNAGYDLPNSKGTLLSLDRFDEGILIGGRIGATKIAITNSPMLAKEADCEILYYCGKYNEMLRYNKAKCVILLNRFELDRLADKFECLKGYEKSIEVAVRPNGAYKVK